MQADTGPAIAALPMYDWPEVRDAHDTFWKLIATRLHAIGIDAPDRLDRTLDEDAGWRSERLLLGQTCGLPLAQGLHRHVAVVGTPTYAAAGCEPGTYCSMVVVRDDDPATAIEDVAGRRLAYNHTGSQSGYAALLPVLERLAKDGPVFAEGVHTGAHRGSIQAVADGSADVAAIDCVSWALGVRHEPAAAKLRVLAQTPPTPGLPMITASSPKRADIDVIFAAVAAAIRDLDASTRDALMIEGIVRTSLDDYRVLAERVHEAERTGDRLCPTPDGASRETEAKV